MPAAPQPAAHEALRPGGPGGPDPACLRDGYVFDPVSGFHWHPFASHWFQPSMEIFLSPKGDLLAAIDARAAIRAALDEASPPIAASRADVDDVAPPASPKRSAGLGAAVWTSGTDSLPEVEIGLVGEAEDDDSFDLPALSIDHEEPAVAAAGEWAAMEGDALGEVSFDDLPVEGAFEDIAVDAVHEPIPVGGPPAGGPEIRPGAGAGALAMKVEPAGGPEFRPQAGAGALSTEVEPPGVPEFRPRARTGALSMEVEPIPLGGRAGVAPEEGVPFSPGGRDLRSIGEPAVRAVPPAANRLDPAEIPSRFDEARRVVIHLRSGASKRGEMKGGDLHAAAVVLHHETGSDPIETEAIKAIFFMREASAPALRPTGSRVRLTFTDGRALEGFAPRKLPSAGGFFVVPADDRTSTAWIFVYPHAIKDLAFG